MVHGVSTAVVQQQTECLLLCRRDAAAQYTVQEASAGMLQQQTKQSMMRLQHMVCLQRWCSSRQYCA